ncbi:MAG TPA: carboxypeptidase-like regulatory domain-containing protein [Bryobacteraceae bacterium]|nr:carboxypeptidase-like regulatory domain-containing protein [Bryobacteraceae bacterium]
MRACIAVFLCLAQVRAADHSGVVKFGGLPVPGASVTARQGDIVRSTITNSLGSYSFTELKDGPCSIQVDMQLFNTERREITIPSIGGIEWELTAAPPPALSIAPKTQMTFARTEVTAAKTAIDRKAQEATTAAPTAAAENLAQRAADGFLINGSQNNGASSPFALLPAFGNNRRGPRSLYNGNFGVIANNALFDARAFSLTGQDTPKPDYSRIQALFAFGGPIRLPGLGRRNAGNFTVNYQWTRNTNATTQTALMPTMEQRASVEPSRSSPQARALLDLYPLPNLSGDSRYNYQAAVLTGLHQDDLQARYNKQKNRNYISANAGWQSVRTDTPDIFGFLATGSVGGLNSGVTYRRTISPRNLINVGLQYSRFRTETIPFFARRQNISAEAGIAGNNQEPINWGPPNLHFSSGIQSLVQPQASMLTNQTVGISVDGYLNRGRHNITYGTTVRKQQFNVLGQQDARGTFAFTGPDDFSRFLQGIPDTSSIAFGNADKYLRGGIHEAFLNDDWRVNPGLTINAGLRWEYWSPLKEKYGRLVNLAVDPHFQTAKPAIERDVPSAFPAPDRNNFAPRVAFSWRPLPASSMVVRGGYGIYYDTSVYQPIAMMMSQQAPLSTSLRIADTVDTPITLANGFRAPASATQATTFGVDPAFRVGYSQNWQLSVQRDLPAGLQLVANYNGGKGTRAQQQFLPNTFPDSLVEPTGYTYLTSNGNSIRHAGQAQLRRRLRNGLTANLQYTYSKSIDNAALGGRNNGSSVIAQNWLDLSAERARSNFDQRHALNAGMQYTISNRQKFLKDWTVGAQITAGSGLPLTPVYFTNVRGTGVTGSVRPDYTGAPVYDSPSGLFLNPAAFAAPVEGRWGNAGRNSINGPAQFALNASVGRTFRGTERVSVDVRVDATNALNNVVYTTWNTIIGSAQFGVPTAVNPMRSVQAILRTRF